MRDDARLAAPPASAAARVEPASEEGSQRLPRTFRVRAERPCDYCATSFRQYRSSQRFCSSRCRFASWDQERKREAELEAEIPSWWMAL